MIQKEKEVSIATRSEPIGQIKYLRAAQFQSHNIHRMIQDKKEKRSIRVSIAPRSESTGEIKSLPHNTAKTQNVFIIIHDINLNCSI